MWRDRSCTGIALGDALSACTGTRAFINPLGGVVFGNDQATTGFRAVGFSFGDAGHGLVGTETTVGIAPGFSGKASRTTCLI